MLGAESDLSQHEPGGDSSPTPQVCGCPPWFTAGFPWPKGAGVGRLWPKAHLSLQPVSVNKFCWPTATLAPSSTYCLQPCCCLCCIAQCTQDQKYHLVPQKKFSRMGVMIHACSFGRSQRQEDHCKFKANLSEFIWRVLTQYFPFSPKACLFWWGLFALHR